MMRAGAVFVAAVLVGGTAFADSAVEPTSLRGHFTFEWTRGTKTVCREVDAKVVGKWKAFFSCRAPAPEDSKSTASGRTLTARCRGKKGKLEQLVFATRTDCEEERETQLANGE